MARRKDFWYKFNINDWETDECRLKLKRENSDTWLTAINIMHKTRSAFIEGTGEQLANMLGLTAEEFDGFFEDLRSTRTAKTSIRKVKKPAPKPARKAAHELRDPAQPNFFPEILQIFRIVSRRLENEFKSGKQKTSPEPAQPARYKNGTAQVPQLEVSSNKLEVKSKNSSSFEEESTHSLTSQKSNFRPPKGQTRKQFLEDLAKDPKYRHIGGPAMLERELAKAEEWCRKNRRHCTPTRFKENWLDRIDRPVNGNGKRNSKTADAGRRNSTADRESAEDVARSIGAEIL